MPQNAIFQLKNTKIAKYWGLRPQTPYCFRRLSGYVPDMNLARKQALNKQAN